MTRITSQYPTMRLRPASVLQHAERQTGSMILRLQESPRIGSEDVLGFGDVLEQGDCKWVHGPALWEREQKFVPVGQSHIELLVHLVAEIPKELDDKYLLGLATRCPPRVGDVIACLKPFNRGERRLDFYRLDSRFDRRFVSVRLHME